MKLITMIAVLVLFTVAAWADVANSTIWSNSTGTVSVTVSYRGTMMGDLDVTLKDDAGKSGTGKGTPNLATKEMRECGTIVVGATSFRQPDGGVMQYQNSAGLWINMYMPPEEEEEDEDGKGTVTTRPDR